MLHISVPAIEEWDEINEQFISAKEQTLTLEHSLLSLSKWEAKWHKPFLVEEKHSHEEIVDYVRCMTINTISDDTVYDRLTQANMAQIQEYIDDKMTATWFSKKEKGKKNDEQVTSELIYYWMIALNIPFECQKWHLNRLLTLIEVCNIKNTPRKPRSKKDILSQNAAINKARRAKLNSKG